MPVNRPGHIVRPGWCVRDRGCGPHGWAERWGVHGQGADGPAAWLNKCRRLAGQKGHLGLAEAFWLRGEAESISPPNRCRHRLVMLRLSCRARPGKGEMQLMKTGGRLSYLHGVWSIFFLSWAKGSCACSKDLNPLRLWARAGSRLPSACFD